MSLNQTGKNFKKDENYSDSLLNLEECKKKCYKLRNKNKEKYVLLQNLKFLSKKNYITTKILKEMKKEHENFKSELLKKLFEIKLDVDKQKILYSNKLNEYCNRNKKFEEQSQKCPAFIELENLRSRNISLQEQYESEAKLFNITKKQYNFIKEGINNTFIVKVCEFCKIILKLKAFEYKYN